MWPGVPLASADISYIKVCLNFKVDGEKQAQEGGIYLIYGRYLNWNFL